MNSLLRHQRSPGLTGPGAAISIVAHVVLIAAAVQVTRAPVDLATRQWIANRIFFIPPPNRVLGQPGAHETLRFIDIAPQGTGSGAAIGDPATDARRPSLLSDLGTGRGRSALTRLGSPRLSGLDSAYSILDVDSAAVRDPESSAPEYPLEMLKDNVQGMVTARFIVDTTGRVDMMSVLIVASTDPAFTASVRSALPGMRFSPARMRDRAVRQLVQQDFQFRITQAATGVSDTTRTIKPLR